ncbi:hypothetical protein [Sphaerisporangium fuscum]|uniref:hypothetical protein n=1 Tax=Sphaerisporangium fuscum TaxID=2835868 RepID=UPI001BDD491A|nr:hypothetical protein [Sphaerisporangium fuscum]
MTSPGAALIAAGDLVHRPGADERLDAERLLREGVEFRLGFDPGQPGRLGEVYTDLEPGKSIDVRGWEIGRWPRRW